MTAEQPAYMSAATAAKRTGVGRATITRRLQAGQIPGATRDERGNWQIPPEGLRAAGLDPAAAEQQHPGAGAAEVARLRSQLIVEQQARAVAETQAEERAGQIAYLQQLLDQVTARQTSPAPRRSTRTPRPGSGSTVTQQTGRPPLDIPPEVAARILDLRGDGSSFQKIADTLNTEGVPTLTGTGKWHKSSAGKVHRRLVAGHDQEERPGSTPPESPRQDQQAEQ